MKRTDLAKRQGLAIKGRMAQAKTPGRYGKDATVPMDKREQRKLDQAQGLIPFAVKLNSDLAKEVQALAEQRKLGLNEVVAELLATGLKSGTKSQKAEPKAKG